MLILDQQLGPVKPILDKEIKEVVFSIDNNKSPGLDGFGVRFFKSAWSLIGKDVIAIVNEFFTSEVLPKELFLALLMLIPTVGNPSCASEYRPITCCSTLYKCISTLIYN